MTREWWLRQRLRGPSAEDSWKIDYQVPLAPLQEINPLKPEHLVALVQTTEVGSLSRRRASLAAATVAKAIGWPEELVTQFRELGKGYSSSRSQVPRELPAADAIEAFIDKLPQQSGLIQSPSQASLPGLSAWDEVGGIAPSLCFESASAVTDLDLIS